MLELPTEIIFMILEYLYEIDLQLLRKTNTYFSGLIKFKELYPASTRLDIVHLEKYKKLILETNISYNAFIKSALQYESFDSIVYLKKIASEIDRFRKIESFIVKKDSIDAFLLLQMYIVIADEGPLNHIKLLHKAGFPKDKNLLLVAIDKNRSDIFKYLFENGCRYPTAIYHQIPEKYINYLKDVYYKQVEKNY